MKLSVLVVGRNKGPLAESVSEFESRASRYWRLEIIEVETGGAKGGMQADVDVRKGEADRLRSRIPQGSSVWALARDGSALTSESLARSLGDHAVQASPGIAFLIGGAYGLDDALIRSADRKLSLSAMTLPHALARLVLAEQLYRAGTILRKEPYHK